MDCCERRGSAAICPSSACCDAANLRGPHPKFERVMRACKPTDTVEPFFQRVAKSRLALALTQQNALEVFRRWNYLCRDRAISDRNPEHAERHDEHPGNTYQSLQTVESLNLPAGEAASGKKFEDYVVKQLYQQLLRRSEDRVFTPRHTLHEPTFSGVFHQFDIVIARPNETVAVECKFRGGAHIDQLFATHGKLVDYRLRPHGVFVTTVVVSMTRYTVMLWLIAFRLSVCCCPPWSICLNAPRKGPA